MDTIPADSRNGIVSDLIDIRSVPLAAMRQWRSGAMRKAMTSAVRRAGKSHVCDQKLNNDWGV